MPRKKLRKLSENSSDFCRFCLKDIDDEFALGQKYKTEQGLIVHYYCLLFACGLQQNGNDQEGIHGFLSQDIDREIKRASKLTCNFCKKKGAASACAIAECRIKYHLPCALNKDVLFHYFDSFPSYCIKHRVQHDLKVEKTIDNLDTTCYICLESLSKNVYSNDSSKIKYQILFTPCCKKGLHIKCVQEQAYNAGIHHMKCPLCNNSDLFINCAKMKGIYIPDKDASWEDSQRFTDLERVYERCDATECICPDGRYYNSDFSLWEIHVCKTCGSCGTHSKCTNEEITFSQWVCNICKEILKKYDIIKNKEKNFLNNDLNNDQNNDQQSDEINSEIDITNNNECKVNDSNETSLDNNFESIEVQFDDT